VIKPEVGEKCIVVSGYRGVQRNRIGVITANWPAAGGALLATPGSRKQLPSMSYASPSGFHRNQLFKELCLW
jgi:hypothetical protein